jgi:hypothetical protein
MRKYLLLYPIIMGKKFIKDCLDSLRVQSYKDFEITVVVMAHRMEVQKTFKRRVSGCSVDPPKFKQRLLRCGE